MDFIRLKHDGGGGGGGGGYYRELGIALIISSR